MKKFKKTYIIDRSKWRCGGDNNILYKNQVGEGITNLCNAANFQCCLGQVSEQEGVPKWRLSGLGSPDSLGIYIPHLTVKRQGYYINTKFTSDCIRINDNQFITLREREKRLKEKFASKGIKLKFINKAIFPNK